MMSFLPLLGSSVLYTRFVQISQRIETTAVFIALQNEKRARSKVVENIRWECVVIVVVAIFYF